MKKILILTFIIMFLVNNYKLLCSDFSGSKTTVSYVIPLENPFFMWGSWGNDIGYKREFDNPLIARTKYTFDFQSIPSNASINSVTLNYTLTNYNNITYYFSIKEIGDLRTPQEIWEGIPSGNVLFQDVSYSSGSISSNDLTNWVNNHKNSLAYLGAYSQNESYTDSYANIEITISVEYAVPPSSIDITAQNNFIYGTIKVGIDEPATQRNSPFPISANVGQTINLEAQNQSYGGYERVWNNHAPNLPSKWIKNGTIDVSTTINYSFQAVQNDDDATYEAGLRKNYTISRNDQTEFDGAIPIGVITHIVEQNSGQISAPVTQTINNKLYTFVSWSDGNTSNPRTIIPQGNETYTVFINIQITQIILMHLPIIANVRL